jgi:hypothetical protein
MIGEKMQPHVKRYRLKIKKIKLYQNKNQVKIVGGLEGEKPPGPDNSPDACSLFLKAAIADSTTYF